MKTPPVPAERAAPSTSAVKAERDRSFLVFAGVVLFAIALGFKSDMLGQGQVWVLCLGLVIVAAPAVLGYLRGTDEFPRIEHYIPVALGAIALTGLSLITLELWRYLGLAALFGAGFIVAARLDYLRLRGEEKPGHVVLQETIIILALAGAYMVAVSDQLNFNSIIQLLWVFAVTFLASYRSFRINGVAISPRRAFIFALFVAQVVTFLAWAIVALQIYLRFLPGPHAVILLFAWYINRGLVRHTVEDSFTRNVIIEYGAFAVLLAFLVLLNYNPG